MSTEAVTRATTSYASHLRGRNGAGGRVGLNLLACGVLLTVASVAGILLGPNWWWSFLVVGLSVIAAGFAFLFSDVRDWRRGIDGKPGGLFK